METRRYSEVKETIKSLMQHNPQIRVREIQRVYGLACVPPGKAGTIRKTEQTLYSKAITWLCT